MHEINEYKVRGAKPKDLKVCYNLLCENTKEYDENLELDVLPKLFPTEEEFEEEFVNTHTRFVIIEHFVNSSLIFDGFITTIIKGSDFSITRLETVPKKNSEIAKILLESVIKKVSSSKENTSSYLISERRLDICKLAFEVGFKKKRFVFHQTKPDQILMVYP